MKLNDLRIATALKLGLGAIVLLVFALAAMAWVQTDTLFEQTKGLYDHPLQVRRAVGALQTDVVAMHRDMKGLLLARDDSEVAATLQTLAVSESDAFRQFEIIRDRYLGPREDIERAYGAFVKWNAIREETIRLVREGRQAEALARVQLDGVGAGQAVTLETELEAISDYARARGDKFYRDAERQHHVLSVQLLVAAAIVFVVSVALSAALIRRITGTLTALTLVTERFRKGDMDARSDYISTNEIGELAGSFNAMAATIQTRARLATSAAELTSVMLREDDPHAFCQELLQALMSETGSHMAAVFFLDEGESAFEHFQSIGLDSGARAAFSAADREGEFGAALATGRIQRVSDISADTRFTLATVSAELAPKDILTIPILFEGRVVAMISLASVAPFSDMAIKLVDDVWGVLTARINGVLAFRKVQDLAERLEHQNRELGAQKRELSAQADELTEQNTELELQKQELDQANRLKSVFLSNMSHELRTPLNSVIALAGVLSRRLQGVIPTEERGYLDVIERNGRNLLALINDILDLSRIEAGRDELTVSRFSLRDLASEVVETLDAQTQGKHVALVQSVAADVPPIISDLTKCRQILLNLVGNAVKFTEHGQVEISAQKVGDSIHVVVADTGIGIAADKLDEIFDAFRQADDSTSKKYGGTGLGLSIAQKYAQMLDGDIAVDSELGHGSTFTLSLPLVLEATGVEEGVTATTPGLPAGGSAPSAPGRGQRLLIVEDSEPAVVQLTDVLTAEGYQVQVARDGREALEQIGEALPDAVILDLMMPEVDGFEVLKEIRGKERTVNLPVLILTARHVTRDELSFLRGNNIYQLIQKGDIDVAGLLKVVGRMVDPRREAVVDGDAPPAPPPVSAPSVNPVILVVEDDPDSRRTASAVLGSDYRVLEADNGRAGVDLAKAELPDLILMDIAMPVMDGVQALREIRADAELRHIPVIAVTASAMSGDRETILRHGFDGYVSKPIDVALLMTALREALHR